MNSFTRILTNNKFTSNKRGVTSTTDKTNVALHVDGDASVNGNMHITEILCDEFVKVSDKRLKTDIKKISTKTSTEIIEGLEPVTFRYKKTNNISIGFIAQDARKIDPKLVKQAPNGFLGLNYDSINVHLLAVVKHLLKEVKEKKSH
jgi:hypothetical protein